MVFVDRDYYLWMLFARVRNVMLMARERELWRQGIRVKQAGTVCAIKLLGDNATPTEISKQLSLETQTISEILDRMEKLELIKRIKGPGKSRRVIISLTEKGEKVYEQSVVRQSIHNIMNCLSEDEKQKLECLLVKIRESSMDEIKRQADTPNSPSKFLNSKGSFVKFKMRPN